MLGQDVGFWGRAFGGLELGAPLIGPVLGGVIGKADELIAVVRGADDVVDDVARLANNAPKKIVPHGFVTADEFGNFGAAITRKMRGAGYDDVQAVLQGSGVTGVRAMSKPGIPAGTPFDVLKASDFDVALVSPKLLAKAKELGIPLRGGGARTGPLWPGNLRAMGVGNLPDDLLRTLYQHEGRRINFMIFESMEEALKRGPSIRIPGT